MKLCIMPAEILEVLEAARNLAHRGGEDGGYKFVLDVRDAIEKFDTVARTYAHDHRIVEMRDKILEMAEVRFKNTGEVDVAHLSEMVPKMTPISKSEERRLHIQKGNRFE